MFILLTHFLFLSLPFFLSLCLLLLLFVTRFLSVAAYKHADGKKIDGRRVLVDVERGRTVKGWHPRRLGKKSSDFRLDLFLKSLSPVHTLILVPFLSRWRSGWYQERWSRC